VLRYGLLLRDQRLHLRLETGAGDDRRAGVTCRPGLSYSVAWASRPEAVASSAPSRRAPTYRAGPASPALAPASGVGSPSILLPLDPLVPMGLNGIGWPGNPFSTTGLHNPGQGAPGYSPIVGGANDNQSMCLTHRRSVRG
jgi:hypothetical protein